MRETERQHSFIQNCTSYAAHREALGIPRVLQTHQTDRTRPSIRKRKARVIEIHGRIRCWFAVRHFHGLNIYTPARSIMHVICWHTTLHCAHVSSPLLNGIISTWRLEKQPVVGLSAAKNKQRPAMFVDVTQRWTQPSERSVLCHVPFQKKVSFCFAN